jgi:hypothetical protein
VTRIVDLDELTPGEKDALRYLLGTEAVRDRRTLSTAEAYEAWSTAELSEGWMRSKLADIGRVRIAARRLITIDRWKPDQIRPAMTTLAVHVCPDELIASMAVEAGIEDALELVCGFGETDKAKEAA